MWEVSLVQQTRAEFHGLCITETLLILGIHVSDRNAELGAGFENPQPRDLHREILLRGAFNEFIERWISKNPPPPNLHICLRLDSRVTFFDPIVLDSGSWRLEVWTYRTAANPEHQA